jgi:sugar/nucleoside kinase (ribokinase family)
MSKLDIAIAGEINLDLILYGLPEQMPTERELLASGFAIALGSSSAILAHNLAALGSRVGFVTKVGDDSFGTLAAERLRERGVDLAGVVHGAKSGVTLILPHGPQRHILTYPGTISELPFEDLDLDYLASARHFLNSSYGFWVGFCQLLVNGAHDSCGDTNGFVGSFRSSFGAGDPQNTRDVRE